jgi:hypothetical protein
LIRPTIRTAKNLKLTEGSCQWMSQLKRATCMISGTPVVNEV